MRVLGNILPGDVITTLESNASACRPYEKTRWEGLACCLSALQTEWKSIDISTKEIILNNVPPQDSVTEGDHGATGLEVSSAWDGLGGP